MPTLKTVKGVKRRLKVTGTGKLMGFRAGRRHLLGGKRSKIKRHLRNTHVLPRVDAKKIRALMPYE